MPDYDPKDQKHLFAFYIEHLSSLILSTGVDNRVIINDKKICYRMVRVLRLRVGDICMLFDRTIHVYFVLQNVQKGYVHGIAKKIIDNVCTSPPIIALLPLLKRDACAAALYSLVEMGVNKVQLVTTSKVQRKWKREREHDRLTHIMVAAAEQAKSFNVPFLYPPQPFEDVIIPTIQPVVKIYFDSAGQPVLDIIAHIKKNSSALVMIMVGPEGGLTLKEKEQVKRAGFLFCALTPTVLRSSQAIALGIGIIRSS